MLCGWTRWSNSTAYNKILHCMLHSRCENVCKKIKSKPKTRINAITLNKLNYAKPAKTSVFIKQLKKWSGAKKLHSAQNSARHGTAQHRSFNPRFCLRFSRVQRQQQPKLLSLWFFSIINALVLSCKSQFEQNVCSRLIFFSYFLFCLVIKKNNTFISTLTTTDRNSLDF